MARVSKPVERTDTLESEPVLPTRRSRGPVFWVLITLLGVALFAGAAAGAFLYGRDTRLSDERVEARLAEQATHDRGVYEQREVRALKRQKKSLKKSFDRRLKREVAAAAETGQSQGYA